MARLIPTTLHGRNPSVGEERVFSFLKRHLLPDDENLVWFEPELPRGKHRPDFVLLGPRFALLVLEVNDWLYDSILRVTGSEVVVQDPDGSARRLPVPGARARAAAQSVSETLRRTPGLTHPEGLFAGNLVVPVNAGIVFPNLTRRHLRDLGSKGGAMSPERHLCRDELELSGDAACRKLLTILARMYVHRFPFRLDDDLRERVRVAIEPQLHFFDMREPGWEDWVEEEAEAEELPVEADGEAVEEAGEAEILPFPAPRGSPAAPVGVDPEAPALPGFTLDPKQERMARELASPRTLVYGPAGSGKTVFLIARAQYWLRHHPGAKILFTCYNSSLASYLRKAFTAKSLPPDGVRLTVSHYHELLSRLLGLGDIHDRGERFYEDLEPRMLREMARREDLPVYDLILVDEGQDFTRRMVEVLERLLAEGGEATIVCDPAQDIYERWSPENLSPLRDVSVEHLIDCYRNTAPIFSLARSILSPEVRGAMGLDRLEMTRPEDVGRDGPLPELVRLDGLDDLVRLVQEAADQQRREGRPLSQIAVLYPGRAAIPDFPRRLKNSRWLAREDDRFQQDPADEDSDPDVTVGTLSSERSLEPEPPGGHFAEALERELVARGVPCEWVARDFGTKAAYDISRDRLTLSTIHSAKGMDFHTVILLGADALKASPGKAGGRAAALLFTGITRARERLVIPYFEERGWVPGLRERISEIKAPR